jgi:thiamine biosynthesis lipoprotein
MALQQIYTKLGVKRRSLLAWLGVLTLLVALTVQRYGDRQLREAHLQGSTMGTTYSVKLGRPVSRAERQAVEAAVARVLARIDALMSTYRMDSELMRFNRHRSTTPFSVSPETIEVLSEAAKVSELSGGVFDVTVAPLVNSWGFGAADGVGEASSPVGYTLLQIDSRQRTLTKRAVDLSCDLSAIAKGYAVDRLAEELQRLHHTDYLVEIGGEVRVRGKGATGEPWRIGIEQPVAGRGPIYESVTLQDGALATSGSYRNFREVDGERLSHTIDPRSRRPVTHRLLSVSVVAERAARADALATALHVLGPSEGLALAEREGLAALLLLEGADGRISERATEGWQRLRRRSPELLARGDRP